MKKYLWTGLLLFCALLAKAQTLTVTDMETGNPLESVTITSQNTSDYAITDAQGQAEISAFRNSDTLEIRCLGYRRVLTTYEALSKQNFKLAMELTGVPFQEVVVSASRFEEKQEDVVQRIQVMRRSELQHMNQTSMADVISNSGHIMVQKSQLGGGSPIIRGFETNKVLLVVDGIRMNNAIYRGGHLQNVVTLDNAIMDRVELVYGPGSVVYGSDALGGVMHFYTRNPQLSLGDSTVVHAGAFTRYFSAANGYSAHADVSVGNRRFGSLTSFTYSDFDDLRQGNLRNPFYSGFGERPWYVKRIDGRDSILQNTDPNVQVGSGYRQYDFLQKFLFRQSNRVQHLLNFQYSTSSDIPRYDRLTQVRNGAPRYGQWYYGPQKRLLASYQLQLENGSWYDHARLIAGYQNIEESRNTRPYQSTQLDHQIEQLDIFTLNIDIDKEVGTHEMRYGFEAWYNKVNSTAQEENILSGETTPSVSRYPDGGSKMYSIAGYFTHTWEISDKLILNDGIRLTDIGLHSSFNDKQFFPFPFDEVNQNNLALNGNIGLIAKPWTGWRFTANLSSGFRAPNVDDMSKVFESVPGSVIVPNPDLKPEYTYNAELGIGKRLGRSLQVSLLGYYTIYRNALTVQPTQFDGQDSIVYDGQLSRVTSTTNAGEAYLYGTEFRISGNLNEYLSMSGSLNYTYGRIKTDSTDYPLDHIPPLFGRLSFAAGKGKFKGEFFMDYSGWKRLKDYNINGEDNIANATANGMPAWYTLNLRLDYRFSRNISLQVACENLLDQNYRVFASNISAPGRNLIVTLRGNF